MVGVLALKVPALKPQAQTQRSLWFGWLGFAKMPPYVLPSWNLWKVEMEGEPGLKEARRMLNIIFDGKLKIMF